MEKSQQEQYYELCYYTLAHPSRAFIHQHIVDAYTAQTATANTKPIAISFALIGLYLYIEKKLTSRQVQQAHIHLTKKKKEWPAFKLPKQRGDITVSDVLNIMPGEMRDAMIHRWCASVWQAYSDSHEQVVQII